MKHVIKGIQPQSFTDWKAKTNEEWQPSYEQLQNPEKRELHEALLIEQSGVCCYCGRAISLADSHIEHFRPQESRKDLALEFNNLHASCIRESKPGSPLHCGHAKGNHFDEAKVISPLELNCEQRFIYLLNGVIRPADAGDASVVYMTDLLRLDIRFLRERRAQALSRVFDDEFLISATDDELVKLAHAYRQPQANGSLTDFGHVLSRYAEQLLGRVP